MSLTVKLYTEVDLGGPELYHVELYDTNIFHCLKPMARRCCLDWLWDYDTADFTCDHFIKGFESSLLFFRAYRENLINDFNDELYYDFHRFLTKLLEEFKKYPKANIHILK